ncbi:MAG TPA: hypothetical protein ENJ37_06060 [Deltaproteobacteria bacterium]|nr:hypothetical protein [Deltaproteobacteria bacterium]
MESRKPGLPLVATGGPQGEVVNAEFLEMEFRGDLWGEFIVTQRSDAFYIIDRHGAAERVAFERLRRSLREGAVKAQMLLLPQRIETTAQERDALVAASETLDRLGFVIEPFGPSLSGGESFILKAVPALLAERDCAALVRDMAVELAAAGGSARAEAAVESVLMRAACHSVVRGAGTVTAEGARALLRDLAVTDLSGHCPHGRPVVRRFTRAEVDAFFRR